MSICWICQKEFEDDDILQVMCETCRTESKRRVNDGCPWKKRSTYAGARGIDPIQDCTQCPAYRRTCDGEKGKVKS